MGVDEDTSFAAKQTGEHGAEGSVRLPPYAAGDERCREIVFECHREGPEVFDVVAMMLLGKVVLGGFRLDVRTTRTGSKPTSPPR